MKLKKRNLKSYSKVESVELVKSGKEYFDTLENLINEARDNFHLQVYILKDDSTGRRISEALKRASKRGVKVYVLVDTIGSFSLPFSFTEDLKNAGVNFRFFQPVISSKGLNLGRRLHRKVAVADGVKALVGGINIAERYEGAKDQAPWLDFAVLIQGSIAGKILEICEQAEKKRFSRLDKFKIKLKFSNKKVLLKDLAGGESLARVRENDWLRNKSSISRSYRQAFRSAEKQITLIDAYFLPSGMFRHLIKKTADRGVKIKIILSHFSDEKLMKRATSYLYQFLLRHHVEIYEYKKAVVHGKTAVVDNTWATIGSHDLNFLSSYGLVEMNIDILGQKFARSFNEHLENIIAKDCARISAEDYLKKKKIATKLGEFFSYHLMRFLLWTLVFMTKKDKQ